MTRLLDFNDEKNFLKNAEIAGEVLKNGGLVAFPTETVYGLGANALCEKAVKNIFKAKGRPADNPLIVHVAKKEDVEKFVQFVPETAKKIMDAFWPGPISIIMKKKDIIPDCVSAGGGAVREHFGQAFSDNCKTRCRRYGRQNRYYCRRRRVQRWDRVDCD